MVLGKEKGLERGGEGEGVGRGDCGGGVEDGADCEEDECGEV